MGSELGSGLDDTADIRRTAVTAGWRRESRAADLPRVSIPDSVVAAGIGIA